MNSTVSQQAREVRGVRKPVYKGVSCVTAGPDGEDIDYFDVEGCDDWNLANMRGTEAFYEVILHCQRVRDGFDLLHSVLKVAAKDDGNARGCVVGFLSALCETLAEVTKGADIPALAEANLMLYEDGMASELKATCAARVSFVDRLKGASHA